MKGVGRRDQMVQTLCLPECHEVKWKSTGEGFMSDVCSHFCVLPASDFKVNTHSFMGPSLYNSLLPFTMSAFVQGIQALVLSALSQEPSFKHGYIFSLLYTTHWHVG